MFYNLGVERDEEEIPALSRQYSHIFMLSPEPSPALLFFFLFCFFSRPFLSFFFTNLTLVSIDITLAKSPLTDPETFNWLFIDTSCNCLLITALHHVLKFKWAVSAQRKGPLQRFAVIHRCNKRRVSVLEPCVTLSCPFSLTESKQEQAVWCNLNTSYW